MSRIVALAIVFLVGTSYPSTAWIHGYGTNTNNGIYQLNLNFPAINGDYVFTNMAKYLSTWLWGDGRGSPPPSDLDANGYPLPGTDTINLHSGVFNTIYLPAEAYVGNNCPGGISGGICIAHRTTGKGRLSTAAAPVVTVTASSLTTGSTTDITFAVAQDFRVGMEAPISTVTGVTQGANGPHPGQSIVNDVFTICAANFTPTTIRLCLNDQVTPLVTSGTASGTITVAYGQTNYVIGVATKGRIVVRITGSPGGATGGILTTDAVSPITNYEMLLTGSEEVRYDLQCPSCIFSSIFLSTLQAAKPGVLRDVQVINYLASGQSQNVDWADRKPVNYYSYASDYMKSAIYAGTTTSSGMDYSVTLGSGAPADRTRVILQFDAIPVTISNSSPAAATIDTGATPHGLQANSPFSFYSTYTASVPTLSSGTLTYQTAPKTVYYAKTINSPTNFTFSTTPGGTEIITTSTSSGFSIHALTVVNSSVSSTGGGSANITWTAHGLSANDPVGVAATGSQTLPSELIVYQNYYVKAVVDANTITLSTTPGGTAVTMAGAGKTFTANRQPTLNLNGTGAIPIRNQFVTPVATVSGNSGPLAFLSGRKSDFAILVYDKVVNAWLKQGGDDNGSNYMLSGWPPEIFVQLCAAIGAHPWIMSPVYALDGYTDPSTHVGGISDYMIQYMQLIKSYQNGAAPWMVPRIDITNETWNSVYNTTAVANAHAYVYSLTAGWPAAANRDDWVGKASSVLGQAAQNVFGGIIGQKYWFNPGQWTASFAATPTSPAQQRLTASSYVGQSVAAQSGYTLSTAYNWMSHIAITNYAYPAYYLMGCTACTSIQETLTTNYGGGYLVGSISGNQLTVTSLTSGPNLSVGTTINGPGVPLGVTISSTSPSGTGTTGTYTLSSSLSSPVGSSRMIAISPTSDATAPKSLVDSIGYTASFTGTISSSVLTASSVTGNIIPGATSVAGASTDTHFGGERLLYSGLANGTLVQITNQLTGTPNGAGTYSLSGSPANVASPIAMNSGGLYSVPALNALFNNAWTFAQGYLNKDGTGIGLTAYEGGYARENTEGYNSYAALWWAGKQVTSTPNKGTGLTGYLFDNNNNFRSVGGKYPSLFVFSGQNSNGNPWAALEDVYQPYPRAYWNGYATWQ